MDQMVNSGHQGQFQEAIEECASIAWSRKQHSRSRVLQETVQRATKTVREWLSWYFWWLARLTSRDESAFVSLKFTKHRSCPALSQVSLPFTQSPSATDHSFLFSSDRVNMYMSHSYWHKTQSKLRWTARHDGKAKASSGFG